MASKKDWEAWRKEAGEDRSRLGFDAWMGHRREGKAEALMMKYTVTVIQEMAFSQTCSFELEAEDEGAAKEQAYDMAFNDEDREWDPNPPECVGWSMQAEEVKG